MLSSQRLGGLPDPLAVQKVVPKVLVPARSNGVGVLPVHVRYLSMLLQVGHVVRGVATLEHTLGSSLGILRSLTALDGIGRRALLGPFPEKLSPKRLCELGGQHVAPGRPRRERNLRDGGGGGVDSLRRRPRDFVDGT